MGFNSGFKGLILYVVMLVLNIHTRRIEFFKPKDEAPVTCNTPLHRHVHSNYPAKHILSWEMCPASKFNSFASTTVARGGAVG